MHLLREANGGKRQAVGVLGTRCIAISQVLSARMACTCVLRNSRSERV